ncbi:MAG: hypothetical protein RLZZ591_1955 [Pseudomonadota bacterium]|jgi:hypothetical protein
MLQNLWPIVLPISTALAVLTLVATAWHQDLRRQVLPAAWVACALAVGALLHMARARLGLDSVGNYALSLPVATPWVPMTGSLQAAWGVALALLLFRPLQWLGWTGRGELRLMMAIGGLLGPGLTLQFAFTALSASVLWVLATQVWQWHMNWVLSRSVLSLARMLPGSIQTFEPAARGAVGLPCGVRTITMAGLIHTSWHLLR